MIPEPKTIRIPDGCDRIALCGGPYSNFAAVEAFLAATESIDLRFCLGDIGGFGPEPNRTLDLIRGAGLHCIQGNYDAAVGTGARDCGCGYADARDRTFAQLSYDYTYSHTDGDHRQWLRQLPQQLRLQWRDRTILLCHGSPERVNEFVWETEASDAQLTGYLHQYRVDGICGTHSGLPWIRTGLPSSGGYGAGFWFNVGVLGRPANNGHRHVYYGLLEFPATAAAPEPRLASLDYDVARVVMAMGEAKLPQEFIDSLETGIWTTCAEILPPGEQGACPVAL